MTWKRFFFFCLHVSHAFWRIKSGLDTPSLALCFGLGEPQKVPRHEIHSLCHPQRSAIVIKEQIYKSVVKEISRKI